MITDLLVAAVALYLACGLCFAVWVFVACLPDLPGMRRNAEADNPGAPPLLLVVILWLALVVAAVEMLLLWPSVARKLLP